MNRLKSFFTTITMVKLLLLYAAILAMVNLGLLGAFGLMKSSLRYEYHSSCVERLNQSADRMDSALLSVKNLGNKFSLTNDITRFRTVSTLSSYNRYSISQIIEDLGKYVLTNEMISDIFLYYKAGDYFISSNGYYSPNDKSFLSSAYFGLSNYRLDTMMARKYEHEYSIVSDKSGNRQLYFLDTIPYSKTSGAGINLVIKIDMDKLVQCLNRGAAPDIFYTDHAGAGLTKDLPKDFKEAEYTNRYNAESYLCRLGGRDYVVYRRDSEVTGGSYLAAFGAESGFAVADKLRAAEPFAVALANLVLLAAGALLFCIFYPKLRKVQSVLDGGCSGWNLHMENFDEDLNLLLAQKIYFEQTALCEKQQLRQYYLIDYLQSPVTDSSLLAEYRNGFLADSADHIYLLCFVKAVNDAQTDEKTYWNLKKSKKFLKESLADKYRFEQYLADGWFVLLFWQKKTEGQKETKTACAGALRKFANKYSMGISFEFSDYFENLDQIKNEYHKLRQSVQSAGDRAQREAADALAFEHRNGNRFGAMLEYIDANVCNPDLDLNRIEEKFGINSSNFSKLFKKNMAVGYLEYIHTKRIEKAVKLLKQTDWTNVRIAQECGYISDIAMIRAFQKYKNTSPGKIRKNFNADPEAENKF